nr:molybdopterin-dependent oxidoreductase [Actinomycetota bacterium]
VLLGADPIADFPDRDLARRGIAGAGFVVAVDAFLTQSSRQADVVLPAAIFGERGGTTTNLEGRISRLNQKVTAPGSARVDWMIAVELASRMGADLGLESLEEIWDEIERLAPSHAGLTSERLRTSEALDGLLPAATADVETEGPPPTMSQVDEPGTSAVAAQGAHHLPGNVQTEESSLGTGTGSGPGAEGSDGAASMAAAFGAEADVADYGEGTTPAEGGGEAEAIALTSDAVAHGASVGDPSGGGTEGAPEGSASPGTIRFARSASPSGPPKIDSYSLRLVSGRKLYDAGTLVQHSPSLAGLASAAPLRVNPADLHRLGLTSGARIRLTSSRTSLVMVAEADLGVPRGTVALPFNQVGQFAADLIDATAAVTDVRLETLAEGSPVGSRSSRREASGG